MDTLITELELNERALESLGEANIDTIAELREYDRDALIALPGIGEVTADQILNAISAYDEGIEPAEEVLIDDVVKPENEAPTEEPIDDFVEGAEEVKPVPAIAQPAVIEEPATNTALTKSEKDNQILQLTAALKWASDVVGGMGRGERYQQIAALLSQSISVVTGKDTAEVLDIDGKLPMKLHADR